MRSCSLAVGLQTTSIFKRCNTDTTLTNLLAGRKQKQEKKTKRLLNLRKYNVVSTLKETAPIYIHTAPSANQNITDVFCRRYRNKIDLD
jgi:hypothetical protein